MKPLNPIPIHRPSPSEGVDLSNRSPTPATIISAIQRLATQADQQITRLLMAQSIISNSLAECLQSGFFCHNPDIISAAQSANLDSVKQHLNSITHSIMPQPISPQ